MAFRSSRRRLLDLCGHLEPTIGHGRVGATSGRFFDVVRHVRDACRIHVDVFHGLPSMLDAEGPFNARMTPLRWLERTAGESPDEVVAELRELAAQEGPALGSWAPSARTA